MNAIFVKGNVLGDVMFYGAGAGKLPTASAVVSDVVDAVKHMGTNIMTIWSTHKADLVDIKNVTTRFFIRVKGDDETKIAAVNAAFNGEAVRVDGVTGEFGYVTAPMTEKEYADKAAGIDRIISMIRYEG